MPTNTVRLHRVLRAPPERVNRTLQDADAMARWLPPNGFHCKVHHMDARVGGSFRMSFVNFSTGNGIPSAACIWSWRPMSGFAKRTSSTIRTCPEKFR
jgi:hypothetical protein